MHKRRRSQQTGYRRRRQSSQSSRCQCCRCRWRRLGSLPSRVCYTNQRQGTWTPEHNVSRTAITPLSLLHPSEVSMIWPSPAAEHERGRISSERTQLFPYRTNLPNAGRIGVWSRLRHSWQIPMGQMTPLHDKAWKSSWFTSLEMESVQPWSSRVGFILTPDPQSCTQ